MNKSPRVIVAGFITTAIQFGLAILGWGGWRPFFSHPALQALGWVTVALLVIVPFTSGNTNTGIREDRGNRWVLAAFGVIAILNSYLPALTDRLNTWTIDGDATRWTGIAMYIGGGALRLLPVFVLGKRFSGLVAIQEGHTLETHGLYGTIRNPSYLGLIICMLGWGLAFRSLVGVLLTALILIPLDARIRSEERLLREYFGAEYETYSTRTWRLIPRMY